MLEAVGQGGLNRERYDNYLKLKRELDSLNLATQQRKAIENKRRTKAAQRAFDKRVIESITRGDPAEWQIGRASCRERV